MTLSSSLLRKRRTRQETHAPESLEHGGALMKIIGYVAMAGALALVAIPLFWIVLTSVKHRADIYTTPAVWWPEHVTAQGYRDATETIPFWDFFRNSVIVTVILSLMKIVLGVMSAYALSLVRFPGRNIVFLVVIAALMVPNQITVISNYALVSQLGWRNTFQGVILPLAGVAFGTFLMRNQFLSVPSEIIEAARMDGAGPLTLLRKVVLPMSWPTLIAFSIITVVNEWNEYLWPFLISDDERTGALPVGLTQLQNNEGITDWGPVMAATVLAMLPVLVLFLLLQRHMIKGLTAGAVKG